MALNVVSEKWTGNPRVDFLFFQKEMITLRTPVRSAKLDSSAAYRNHNVCCIGQKIRAFYSGFVRS